MDRVIELLTMVIGPESLMVAARADLGKGMSGDDVEQLADQIDHEVREVVPSVTHFFLDPTPPRRAGREGSVDRDESRRAS